MFVTPAYAEEAPAEGQINTETGVAHEEHATGVFPPFDTTTFASQLLWLVITFGLFYMLMQKVIVPRVGSILENRHDRIAQDLDEAARLKSEADAAIETYERELSAAKAKAGQIASVARDEAKAKADAERAKVEADLNAKIAAAETRIAEIKAKAFAEVDTIAIDTVGSIVEELIGSKATAADIKAAVSGVAKQGA
ncbi:ATP F0F1 synthase subunit B' [Rhizobium sp. Root274]|uniref:ATP synthase subunit b n=1 Tax=Rhizobium glycinendophyticum TaxID=2589807 RepID=A0A504U9X6_9HYPH|nr:MULTISPECIES: F0F1 ATP synthase subunit B [Rhizobium]KQW31516.1 ATP F0F1 synthase subunit B' [Rhizobium sp. Root1240]KRD33057.1 ATP F0F1 synthase subunit B' [Rhizobium sp. Root274]TPP10090.1 F0F1 ATP synthase subunit B [Rhizobium glycinendophyticum]